MMFTTSLIFTCLAGLVLTLFGEYRERSWAVLAGKLVAASAYIGVALVEGALATGWGRALLLGMLCCWAGDLLLVSRRRRSLFLAGLGAFLAGHLLYSLAFALRGVGLDGLLLPMFLVAVFVILVQRWLRPHLDRKMAGPVHAYLAAISLMWLMAMASHAAQASLLLLVGASLFVLSDLAVARNRFIVPAISNRLWGLPLYFTAQILLALSTSP